MLLFFRCALRLLRHSLISIRLFSRNDGRGLGLGEAQWDATHNMDLGWEEDTETLLNRDTMFNRIFSRNSDENCEISMQIYPLYKINVFICIALLVSTFNN